MDENKDKISKKILDSLTMEDLWKSHNLREIIKNKNLSDDVLKIEAKRYACFSGTMRNRLIGWLDNIGIQKSLGIQSSSHLFEILGQDALHSTSVLRNPAFINKKNY